MSETLFVVGGSLPAAKKLSSPLISVRLWSQWGSLKRGAASVRFTTLPRSAIVAPKRSQVHPQGPDAVPSR